MPIRVDSWTTGLRGDMVQLPLVRSIQDDGRIEQRVVYCSESPKAVEFQSLGLASCPTLGTRRVAALPGVMKQIPERREALRQWYADGRRLVHVAMWSPWDHFYLDIPKRAGAKLLLTVHDAQKHIGEENWLLSLLENRIIHQADHIAVLSDYARDVLSTRLGRSRQIDVVAPGLIMNTDSPGQPRSWPMDRPLRFLFFGRIHAYKGLDILLDAWDQLSASGAPPMSLTIVGSGDIAPYSAAIARARNVSLRHGWISDDEMRSVFAEHDVNVMAYRETSASATALAGLWAALPSVVTPIDGLKDYFVDGHNALTADNISAEAMARSMLEITQSPTRYAELSKGAYEMATRHSARAVVANWYGIYERMWAEQGWV